MTSNKIPRLLARFFKRSQRTGGRYGLTKVEEGLHAVVSSAKGS